MITKEDLDKYFETRESILNRLRELKGILVFRTIEEPSGHYDYKIGIENITIRGRYTFPTEYLSLSKESIIMMEKEKKRSEEDRLLRIKKANAIEGYKENLELVELAKKELVELGVDPDTIKAD